MQPIAAASIPSGRFRKKKIGSANAIPIPKQISCRAVKFSATLVFTFDKSLGTLAFNAIVPSYLTVKICFDKVAVLNKPKQNNTLMMSKLNTMEVRFVLTLNPFTSAE